METTDIKKFQNRDPDAVRVLASFRAKPGKGKDLEGVLQTLVVPTRAESGNIAYVLHRSIENPEELLFDEIYSSMKAFEEHRKKPYIKNLMTKIGHLIAAPAEIKTYVELRAAQ